MILFMMVVAWCSSYVLLSLVTVEDAHDIFNAVGFNTVGRTKSGGWEVDGERIYIHTYR